MTTKIFQTIVPSHWRFSLPENYKDNSPEGLICRFWHVISHLPRYSFGFNVWSDDVFTCTYDGPER